MPVSSRPVIHWLVAECSPKTGYPSMGDQRVVLSEEADALRTKGYITIADPSDEKDAADWDHAHQKPKRLNP